MAKIKDCPIHKEVIKRLTKKTALELYNKLIDKKQAVQNSPQAAKQALSLLGNERGGDQADQVNRLQEEAQQTGRMQRDIHLLEQIALALARMEKGQYGICEKTGETIEPNRLRSIPWTTLSIEGAELEESEKYLKKTF